MSMPPPGPPTGGYQSGPPPGMPSGPTAEERNWALAAHIGTLVAAWVAMGFLAPLIVLLVKGKDSSFVRRHAVESLNFQISLLVYLVASGILVLVLVGIFLLIAVGIFALIVIILATIAASSGQDYRYPLTIRLIS
jgi:uncharacterized Tic20 family protein